MAGSMEPRAETRGEADANGIGRKILRKGKIHIYLGKAGGGPERGDFRGRVRRGRVVMA